MEQATTSTVAVVSILCCAAVRSTQRKHKGGGRNHIQRGIQLAQKNILTPPQDEFSEGTIKGQPRTDARDGYANRGQRYHAGSANASRGRFEGASTRYPTRVGGLCAQQYIELAPKDAYGYRGTRVQTLSNLNKYTCSADFHKAVELKPDDLNAEIRASMRSD